MDPLLALMAGGKEAGVFSTRLDSAI